MQRRRSTPVASPRPTRMHIGGFDGLWKMLRLASPLGSRELVLLGVLVCMYLVLGRISRVHTYTPWKLAGKLLWKNATTRPPVLIILILSGWSWVVRTCTSAGMELEHVLGGPVKPSEMGVTCALVLLNMFLAVHLMHFVASEWPGMTWRPWLVSHWVLHVLMACVFLAPHHYLHADTRASLVRTAWDSLIAPLAPVTFWHVIVADYATSLAKAFADLQLMVCETTSILRTPREPGMAYVRTTDLWERYHGVCVDSVFNPLLLALPFWCRLWQCLHVYSKTREQKNLWNALKYSSAFPLVYMGWLRRHSPSRTVDRLFVLAAVVNSMYTFVWDILMDWGMLQWNAERGCWRLKLREQMIISPRRSVYGALMVFNFALRFIWAMAVFGTVPTRGHGMFFFESFEVVRRTVWAVFRIEWEYVTKVLPRGATSGYASIEKDSIDGEDPQAGLLDPQLELEAIAPLDDAEMPSSPALIAADSSRPSPAARASASAPALPSVLMSGVSRPPPKPRVATTPSQENLI